MIETADRIKETGATFTPIGLADYLSDRILTHVEKNRPVILDPSCGDGALLRSIGHKLDLVNAVYSLKGFDMEARYLRKAEELIRSNCRGDLELKQADFLEEIDLVDNQPQLLFDSSDGLNRFADVVIANPPYVRTQVLGANRAQDLAAKFNLKGRVDLYYPFLISMTHALKDGGILGVITSNRFLFTKSGESIRKFLFDNYEILEVIDLGDTKLFEAAVLPAIFIGRKKVHAINKEAKFLKIYEDLNGYEGKTLSKDTVYNVLNTTADGYFSDGAKRYKKTSGSLKFKNTKENTWAMLSSMEKNWVDKIEQASVGVVADYFKVRVGIKTTADKVFIGDKWEELGDRQPEESVMFDLISQQNLKPWSLCGKKKLRVLYTHECVAGKKQPIDLKKFPKAEAFLQSHREVLEGRDYVIRSGRKWYEIWVPQNPDAWQRPKLVFPDISPTPRFYYDESGKVVNGNCYWICATKADDNERLLLVQGIANTNLMTKYHDLVFSNKLYAGRRRYFSQYVQNYPLPDIKSPASRTIIETTLLLNSSEEASTTNKLQRKLEQIVAEAYGVEPVFTLD